MVNHYLTPGAIIDSSHTWDETQTIADDTLFNLGTDGDIAIMLKSGTYSADATLAGVFVGSPQTPDLTVNSLIISNITEDGQILFATRRGADSHALLHLNGSLGRTFFYSYDGPEKMRVSTVGVTINVPQGSAGDFTITGQSTDEWVKFDVSAEELLFAISTTIKVVGALTFDPTTNVRIGGTADHGTTRGINALSIFNGTPPAGTLSNGASIYSEGGVMKVINADGSGGTINYT